MDPEEFCGIEEYGTSAPGVGGVIKKKPEDFVVEEVPVDLDEGGNYLLYRLHKKNMTTYEAVEKLSSIVGVSTKRVNYAGLKDKRAYTTQFITLEGLNTGDVEVDTDNLGVQPVKKVSRPLRAGDLKRNRFEIALRGIELDADDCRSRLERLTEEIGEGIPNYYGLQRFGGNRPVTHLVGRRLLERDFEGAVKTYLVETFDGDDGAQEARKRLEEEEDYGDALGYFPEHMHYEIKLLERIEEVDPSSTGGWKQVFRAFPRNLRRLFVHAYQSYVFNRALSMHLREDDVKKNFPAKVPGHGTRLGPSGLDGRIQKVLEEDGVSLQDFRFKEMGELSAEGTLRPILMSPEVKIGEIVEENSGLKATVSFSLKPGRYATVVTREITKKRSEA